MENIEVITPSGHRVYIKPYLTYAEKKEIDKLLINKAYVDPVTKTVTPNPDSINESEIQTIKIMVKRVIDKNGVEIESSKIMETLFSWDYRDTECVKNKIDEITNPQIAGLPQEKKESF